jgi:hypothetical protein
MFTKFIIYFILILTILLIPIKQTGIVTQSYINYTDRYNFQDHLWLKMKKGSNIITPFYISNVYFTYHKITE